MTAFAVIGILIGLLIFLISRRTFAYIYLFFLYLSEFYWLNFLGGILKPFHLISAFLFIIYSFIRLPTIKSRILASFILFFIFQGFYLLIKKLPAENSRTLLLYATLLTISINIYFLFKANILTAKDFLKITLIATILIEIVGIVQYLGWRIGGVNLSLTETQKIQLTFAHRYPSFFTEADNCGKYLAVAQLIVLPSLLQRRNIANYFLIGSMLVLFLLNMTRTAIGAFVLSLISGYMFLSVFSKSKTVSNIKKIFWISSLSLLVTLYILSFTDLGITFQQRIYSLLNIGETLKSDPALFPRIETITNPLNLVLSGGLIPIIFGMGWGASYQSTYGIVKGSSNLFVTFFFFAGLVGLIFILYIIAKSLKISLRAINKKINVELAEGTLLAMLASVFMGLISSNIIAPEFWILLGIVSYLENELRKQKLTDLNQKPRKYEYPHRT